VSSRCVVMRMWPLGRRHVILLALPQERVDMCSRRGSHAPSESIVPESSVSNSLNASRISSSWSLVSFGADAEAAAMLLGGEKYSDLCT
jgi:hypothetical protein